MFFSKTSYKKKRENRKGGLRKVYDEHHVSLKELLNSDQGSSVHRKDTNTLLSEIYKTYSGDNPYFMKSIFTKRDVMYNLRT